MTLTLVAVAVLSLVVGIALGMLGGGGSIMMVPLLVYVAGVDTKSAIAMSLFVVGATSAAGVTSHAKAHRVRWRTGITFGFAGMTGAFVGGLLGGRLPGAVLLTGFALMMVATSVAMLRGRSAPTKPAHTELPVGRVVVDGIVVGLVTGLVGAGGGFLVVPALALLGGLPMTVAVGTSLVVLTMKSFAGLAGYLSVVHIDWSLTLTVTALAIVGSLVGGRLINFVAEDRLRRAFGWFVLSLGSFMLAQQVPSEFREVAMLILVTGVAAISICWNFVKSCPVRRFVHV
jgi:hypothetical protein